ncbi:hypothetical protein [Herbaspirillum sp. CAH-3]|jgi:hypothetical protein|uniref:hypothetical protein n=1 Tax=Herbaspirillum sp. CAH-3 TaxID=2605746 RepID=UPI0012AC9404|nr:hypothetical protein [Herbaspirillum sp. CAH-3]
MNLEMPVLSSEFTGLRATFQSNITNIRHLIKNMIFDENDLVNVITFLRRQVQAGASA